MVDIVFNDDDDVTFLGENIFGHDFVHDFNVVNMKDRLAKIGSDIDKIKTAMTGGGSTPTVSDPDDAFEADTDFNDYLECGDCETTSIPRGVSTLLDSISTRLTRQNVNLIQECKNFIYEGKLFVLGFFNSVPSTGSIPGDPDITSGGDISSFFNSYINSDIKLLPEIENKTEIENKKGRYSEFLYKFVRDGFESAIQISGDFPELKSFFEFMKKFYLFYENSENHPFVTFNNTFIEDAMFLYLLDNNAFINDEDTHNILTSLMQPLQKVVNANGSDKMVGGEPLNLAAVAAFRDEILRDCTNLFDFIDNGTVIGEPGLEPLYLLATRYKDRINSFTMNGDSELSKLNNLIKQLQKRNPKKFITLGDSKQKYSSASARVKPQERIKYSKALSDFIRTSIYEPIDILLNDMAERLANSAAQTGSLSDTQRTHVQKISAIVSQCVTQYIGVNVNASSSILLKQQHSILSDVANNKNIGSADENLLKSFKNYAGTNGRDKVLLTIPQVKSKISSLQSGLRIINNAATDAISQMGKMDKIICPNSSVIDAMGTFGSCSGTSNSRETNNMEFTLRNNNDDRPLYYTGTTVYDSKKQLQIIYSAQFNDFVLPYVEKKIDMKSTKHITELSANTTFKSVINKILSIWKKKFTSATPPSSVFWQSLTNPHIFAELVSVGSLKSVGDLYQEINSVALNGGYISGLNNELKVSFRVGVMGDRPSGVRAGFILLKANSGIHPKSIAGYFDPAGTNMIAIINNTAATRGGKKTKRKTLKIMRRTQKTKRRIKGGR